MLQEQRQRCPVACTVLCTLQLNSSYKPPIRLAGSKAVAPLTSLASGGHCGRKRALACRERERERAQAASALVQPARLRANLIIRRPFQGALFDNRIFSPHRANYTGTNALTSGFRRQRPGLVVRAAAHLSGRARAPSPLAWMASIRLGRANCGPPVLGRLAKPVLLADAAIAAGQLKVRENVCAVLGPIKKLPLVHRIACSNLIARDLLANDQRQCTCKPADWSSRDTRGTVGDYCPCCCRQQQWRY